MSGKDQFSVCGEYIRHCIESINAIESDYKSLEMPFPKAVSGAIGALGDLGKSNQIFIIGNGGSASIASMAANRFWKFCGLKTQTLNEPAMLSATANDNDWESVYEIPLNTFGQSGDILIAISSSGKSRNIIKAVAAARSKKMCVITLSGFKPDNELRQMGNINFYVPKVAEYQIASEAYRHTERTHLFILDYILDMYLLINQK